MEEKLMQYIGKKIHITFESKRFKSIFNLTGKLVSVGVQWTCFIEATSDYPEGVFDCINTSRIRSIEEIG